MNKSAIAVLLGGISLCIFLLVNFDAIGPLGRHIPQDDLTTDYLFGVLWAVVLGLSIFVWPVNNSDRRNLIIAWAARCLVTLVFMLFYEYYYDLDSFGYFYNSTHSVPWEWTGLSLGAGTANLWRLAWLHSQVLPYSYHLMKVSFSMAGFVATYIFYKAAIRFLNREDTRIFFALSLFPSILFWSSTLGKDPVVLLGISIYVYGVAAWYKTNNLRHIFVILIGIWAAMTMRIWLGPILLAPLAVFVLTRMRSWIPRLFFISIIAGAFLFAAGRFQEQFNIETSQDLVSSIDMRAHSTGWEGGSGQQTGAGFSSIGQLLAFIPIGAFTALFRPLPGEVQNPFGWLAGMENLLLLCLLIQALKRAPMSELRDPRIMWALVLILTWSSIYGFISYQNLGAAVRFRLQILPVMLGTLLYLRRDRRRDERSGQEKVRAGVR